MILLANSYAHDNPDWAASIDGWNEIRIAKDLIQLLPGKIDRLSRGDVELAL